LDELRGMARKNRKEITRSEAKLWYEYLNKRPLGYKFLRQKPIGRFIADFYCSKILLIIEIDGGYHFKRRYVDFERDREFERRGIKTIRFTNEQICSDLPKIVEDINRYLKASLYPS